MNNTTINKFTYSLTWQLNFAFRTPTIPLTTVTIRITIIATSNFSIRILTTVRAGTPALTTVTVRSSPTYPTILPTTIYHFQQLKLMHHHQQIDIHLCRHLMQPVTNMFNNNDIYPCTIMFCFMMLLLVLRFEFDVNWLAQHLQHGLIQFCIILNFISWLFNKQQQQISPTDQILFSAQTRVTMKLFDDTKGFIATINAELVQLDFWQLTLKSAPIVTTIMNDLLEVSISTTILK